ncbi:hypothetical protein POM88_024927 [Heracleum sosnowskyi]|uniref:Uncharacterized protein n=1 Tax=Heracleum sosnowskyi TaxID=360622 RepID=A0AAD8MNC6_9APIA|nr:hypothetical protein POM88_024927 [Heracleum sosnowskyi]
MEFLRQSSTTVGLPKEQDNPSGPLSVAVIKIVEEKERDEALLHVLQNNTEVYPYIIMHKEYLEKNHQGKKKSVHWLMGEHNRLIADWFEKKSSDEMRENGEDPVDSAWSIVLTSTTRDYHEMYNDDDLGDTIMEHPPFCSSILACDVTVDDVAVGARPNVEGIWVKK